MPNLNLNNLNMKLKKTQVTSLNKDTGNKWIGSVGFTAIYLFIVYQFKTVDVWNNHFAETGYTYIFYNLSRVIFLFYLAWIFYYTGRLFLSFLTRKLPLGSLDTFLLSSSMGASVYISIMFFLGISKLLYTFNALAITAPIVFISYRNFKGICINANNNFRPFFHELIKKQSRINIIFTLLLSVAILYQAVCLFVTKGLLPGLDAVNNDSIGYYMPYFNECIKHHSIWLNKYFLGHFNCKGAGLHFLSVLLTDIQSLQLVSFYVFFLISLVLFSIIKELCNKELLWPLLSVVLYFSSSMSIAEFQKLHITAGAFIIFVVYMGMIARYFIPDLWRLWGFIQTFIIINTIILSPTSFAFTFSFILFQSLIFFVLKRKSLFKCSVISAGVIFAFFASVLIFNYFSSGMFEITPPAFFSKYTNESIMQKWISPALSDFYFNIHAVDEIPSSIKLDRIFQFHNLKKSLKFVLFFENVMFSFRIYFLLLVVSAIIFISALKKGSFRSGILDTVLPICFMTFLGGFIAVTTNNPSLYRGLGFLAFFRITLYIYSLYLLINFLVPKKAKGAIIILAITTVAVLPLTNFNKLSWKNVTDGVNFLSGKTNYAELYQKTWGHIMLGLDIQKLIGHNNKVISLNFLPALYGLPKSGFQRFSMNDYSRYGDFETVMFGDAERSINTLKKHNINYFLIVLNHPLLPIALSPILEPESIKQNFKIAASFDGHIALLSSAQKDGFLQSGIAGLDDSILLLRWRKKGEPEINSDFVMSYSKLRVRERSEPNPICKAFLAGKK